MSIEIGLKTYEQDTAVNPNRMTYVGPAHTFTIADVLVMGRTAPKPDVRTGFKGVSKTDSRFARSVEVDYDTTQKTEGIIRVETSLPVGTSEADVDALIADFAEWVGSAEFGLLVKKHDINH